METSTCSLKHTFLHSSNNRKKTIALKDQVHTTISCSGCGTCCSIPIVPVTDSDIKRLVKTTGKKASDLVKFYSPSEMEFDEDAEVWIRLKQGKRAMGLRRKNEKCIFLDDTNRCTVYQSRPMTCRTFPYVIDFNDDGSIEVSLNDIVDCKCIKLPDSDLIEVIAYTVSEDQEDDAYFKKIRNWNLKNQPGGAKEFLLWCKL